MTEMSRRERKKKETREKIFSNAMQLFRLQGFTATSVDQITQQADVGKGTFYNYFSTKEAVVLEFSRRSWQDLVNEGRQQVCMDTRQRLGNLLQDWAGFMIKDREIAWVTVRNRDGADYDLSLHYALMAIITVGQQNGEISREFEPAFLAESLEGMMVQHFMRWFVSGSGNLHEELNHALMVFLDGLSEKKQEA
ncbi:TetR/AcrR family transcriptional regulator [Desulfosporosinus sp. BICA1-9]|uniref:TetR/AcrR family transcriptional regulator n=1 Tax=Desulfosporosinus sp. BICA1-9 TaxID=1531958 RepID=UPI00054B4636|nr:TetR/AcrR family transcriptional regulator [Desulfosporosinus sp. BICA1-9]KJS84301.1 MAG: transcriptional regulator [Desulfosporosinus sp. BICA1-9]KJS89015.1 MAG: transcriptional regulator [Desulfosporosinus sp. BICA1-9]HBW39053.1 TetR/AcrR family transcriptional regulator [Desulfosporosinus sp.]